RAWAPRSAGRGDDPESAEHGGFAVHSTVGEDRADSPIASRAVTLPGRDRVRAGASPGEQGDGVPEPDGPGDVADGDGQLEPGGSRYPGEHGRASEAGDSGPSAAS